MTLYDIYLFVPMIALAVMGVVIVYLVQRHRNASEKSLAEMTDDSFVVVTKTHYGDQSYADNVYLERRDDQLVTRVAYVPFIFGYYLPAGDIDLVLSADYGSGRGKVKTVKGIPLTVQIEKGKNYRLSYHIPTEEFIFEEYDNPRLFKTSQSNSPFI